MPVSPAIAISPARVGRVLGVAVAVLALSSTAGQLLRYLGGYDWVYGLVPKFFVGQENNVPTWFSSGILLLATALLALIAVLKHRGDDRFARHWAVLALVFGYISMDESASLHELAIAPTRELLGVGGFLYFAWVLPAAALLLFLAIAYWKFLFHLPARSRGYFIAAAALYIGGALGVELVGGRHYELHGGENLTYSMLQTVEETLEMAGVVLFIYALLRYLSLWVGTVRIRFVDAPEPAERRPGGAPQGVTAAHPDTRPTQAGPSRPRRAAS